jgi:GrpB-like predicted nucleotidyltransferase (UPF0157 family)
MPFDDEVSADSVQVVAYRMTWPAEFARLGGSLASMLGTLARRIDHVGSTSVPGLAAKDCLDVQVSVDDLADPSIDARLTAAGYRQRPEPWNHVERSFGVASAKLVYAPPIGARTVNVHVRALGSAGARYALLFRDYLRADDAARDAWGAFKMRLAQSVPDIYDYGQIKTPATEILMQAAVRWAESVDWTP